MIIRRSRNSNFTIVPNEPIDDRTVSADALALLVYLLSRPDDWTVHVAQLRSRFGYRQRQDAEPLCGSSFGMVTSFGSRCAKTGSNRFRQFEYVVYDEPQSAREKPRA